MNTEKKVARILLKIGAVNFPEEYLVFKSGIKSPIYIDNRELPFCTEDWKVVLDGFKDEIQEKNISYEIIVGVAVGGIPHSSTLSYILEKPSVFVRKEAKGYGRKKLVEGGDIKGKSILLIEDVVSSGASSLNAVRELKKEGGSVEDCLVIFNYGFKNVKEKFEEEGVRLHSLTSFLALINEAFEMKIIDDVKLKELNNWYESC